MENNIEEITRLLVKNEEKMVIDIKYDIFNEKLIFEGKQKLKFDGLTKWILLGIEEYPVGTGSNVDKYFDSVIKSLYLKMKARVASLILVRTFLHEVTEVEIKE